MEMREGRTVSNSTSQTPADLIPLREAAQLIPSRVPGRKLHVSTLVRWVQSGRLRAWRSGRHLFVSRAEVPLVFVPVPVVVDPLVEYRRERLERSRRTEEVLRKAGLEK
jgi:hypothetical protein